MHGKTLNFLISSELFNKDIMKLNKREMVTLIWQNGVEAGYRLLGQMKSRVFTQRKKENLKLLLLFKLLPSLQKTYSANRGLILDSTMKMVSSSKWLSAFRLKPKKRLKSRLLSVRKSLLQSCWTMMIGALATSN
jgi:hypothetical protein